MTLSENAKLRRRKHARQNWKNKVKRRKLEAKGQTEANVEEGGPMAAYVKEMAQMVPNVDEGAGEFEQGPNDVDFSTVKIRQEKIDSSREEEEKLKRLQEESKQNPGSHPFDEVIVEENQRTVAEFCKKENLVLPADEVGGESRRSTSISQEDLEELMTSVKKDPYLKPIPEDIETGGPTVMMSGSHNMKLSENAKLRRRKHARENWKNKVKRRKLEAKGQTEANVEEGGPMAAYIEAMAQIVPNVDKGAPEFGQGLDDVDFSIIKIRREKVEYSREEQEKLKCLQEESKDNPGSHPSNEIILEENQQTVVAFCKNENSNLVLSADEVGDESRTSTSISQEDLEELMTSVKKDPYLKTILEDIETGGPTVMMRYLNDSEITQKLALAMGFGVFGGYSVNSVEHNAPNADAEDQTAKQA